MWGWSGCGVWKSTKAMHGIKAGVWKSSCKQMVWKSQLGMFHRKGTSEAANSNSVTICLEYNWYKQIINIVVGTTPQNGSIVFSYCAASEVPVARLPGSSGFGKACCFFSRQHGRFGKACFLFTFVQCTVSLSAGCFFECVTGKTPVTQSNQKRRVMKKMNIINKSIHR